jgi:DhnA family fructose-bisphosphate aldolase class Ia
VKVNYPKKGGYDSKEVFKEAILAAGNTKVLCAGGESVDVRAFLQRIHDQINVSGAAGNATGRNIHQKSLREAVRMCNAIYAITIKGKGIEEAMGIYEGR